MMARGVARMKRTVERVAYREGGGSHNQQGQDSSQDCLGGVTEKTRFTFHFHVPASIKHTTALRASGGFICGLNN